MLDRPGQPRVPGALNPVGVQDKKNILSGLPPLMQRKSSSSRMKPQFEDGKAQAEADLKAINEKI